MNLSEGIIDGYIPDVGEYRTIVSVPDDHVFHIMVGADLLRHTYLSRSIPLAIPSAVYTAALPAYAISSVGRWELIVVSK